MSVEFNSPVEHRFYGAKTHCGHCDAEASADRPLLKCTGCGLSVYCSKDCQKAAWAEHKIWCRSSKMMRRAKFVELMESLTASTPRPPPPLPSRTGEFSSAMSVTVDWRKFFECHQMTLMDFLEVAQRLAHTPHNLELLRRGELLLQCHFFPVKPSAQPNPANSWYLSHWEVTPADALKEYGARYIGCLVMVNRLGVTVEMVLRPIWAARNPEMLALQETKDALSDLLEFFVGCVNTGVVRQRDAADNDAVKPGKLHRVRGTKMMNVYREVLRSRKYTPKTDFKLVALCYFKDALSL
ncbi:hypothetical protein C8T65DRAFT_827835 [Cerioporus squamosus]|nr:hypothetical protein C8T65DRAFT_827835 [Cerioporus squamosus]